MMDLTHGGTAPPSDDELGVPIARVVGYDGDGELRFFPSVDVDGILVARGDELVHAIEVAPTRWVPRETLLALDADDYSPA